MLHDWTRRLCATVAIILLGAGVFLTPTRYVAAGPPGHCDNWAPPNCDSGWCWQCPFCYISYCMSTATQPGGTGTPIVWVCACTPWT